MSEVSRAQFAGLLNIDINTTLRDAQNAIVLSLLPRTHDVAIEGRHIGGGYLVPLRLDYRQLAGEWRLRP